MNTFQGKRISYFQQLFSWFDITMIVLLAMHVNEERQIYIYSNTIMYNGRVWQESKLLVQNSVSRVIIIECVVQFISSKVLQEWELETCFSNLFSSILISGIGREVFRTKIWGEIKYLVFKFVSLALRSELAVKFITQIFCEDFMLVLQRWDWIAYDETLCEWWHSHRNWGVC